MSFEEFVESGRGTTWEEYEDWCDEYNCAVRSETSGWYYED